MFLFSVLFDWFLDFDSCRVGGCLHDEENFFEPFGQEFHNFVNIWKNLVLSTLCGWLDYMACWLPLLLYHVVSCFYIRIASSGHALLTSYDWVCFISNGYVFWFSNAIFSYCSIRSTPLNLNLEILDMRLGWDDDSIISMSLASILFCWIIGRLLVVKCIEKLNLVLGWKWA